MTILIYLFIYLSIYLFILCIIFFIHSKLYINYIYFNCVHIYDFTLILFISIDRTLLGAAIPDQSGPWSDGIKGIFRISQRSSITAASPSDCLELNTGHSLGESYLSADMQSGYSAAPDNWTKVFLKKLD